MKPSSAAPTLKEPLSKRLDADLETITKDLEYATKIRKEAIRATKNRKRTNNIYDPEYCAFYEGRLFGEMMTLNGQRQHLVDGPERFHNDPTLIDSVKALEADSSSIVLNRERCRNCGHEKDDHEDDQGCHFWLNTSKTVCGCSHFEGDKA